MPLLIGATYLFKANIQNVYREVNGAAVRLNSFIQSRLTGMKIIQIFNQEETQYKKFQLPTESHKKVNNKSNLYYSIYFPSLEIMRSIGISLLIWYGAKGILQEIITLGKLIAFIMYIKMFFRPASHLAEHFNTLQVGLVSSSKIIEVLDNNKTVSNNGTCQPKHMLGKVRFENVGFGYTEQGLVLKNIFFDIPAKQSLAIVGATEAEKSTIINLLERFYEP